MLHLLFLQNPGKLNQINLGNTDIVTVDPGDVIYVSCGGAGGWGCPIERDPNSVLYDYKCGWITRQHAKEIYGVVISGVSIDKKATTVCRKTKKSWKLDKTPLKAFTMFATHNRTLKKYGPSKITIN